MSTAATVGIALALAILGFELNGATSSESASGPARQAFLTESHALLPGGNVHPTPYSHSHANTEGKTVYLNQKVINGEPTVLCTQSEAILTAMEQAVAIWNKALSGTLTFSQNNVPFTIYSNNGLPPSSCDDNKPSIDVDVVVIYERSSDSSVYDSKKSDMGQPPRKLFETDNEASYLSDEHASIVLRSLVGIRVSTLVHELGHALGLSDYKDCDELRNQGKAHQDPDPEDQHYSLMAKHKASCRPIDENTITGRDLRDLYEAYHVGAITNVAADGDIYVGSKQIDDMMLPKVVEFTLR